MLQKLPVPASDEGELYLTTLLWYYNCLFLLLWCIIIFDINKTKYILLLDSIHLASVFSRKCDRNVNKMGDFEVS